MGRFPFIVFDFHPLSADQPLPAFRFCPALAVSGLEVGGKHVNQVEEAITRLWVGFDLCWPAHDHWVARNAKVGGDLSYPLERNVASPGPAYRVVRL